MTTLPRKSLAQSGPGGQIVSLRVPDLVGLTVAEAISEWTLRGQTYLVTRPYNRNHGPAAYVPYGFTGAITPGGAPTDAIVATAVTDPVRSPGQWAPLRAETGLLGRISGAWGTFGRVDTRS
jgi:hypothetical protein